jgi:hypothetical protein
MRKRFLLLGAALFLILGLNAQSYVVKGTVVDQHSQSPLSSATVRLKSVDSTYSKSTLSDKDGKFTFSSLWPDSLLLTVSFVGFNDFSQGIRIDTNDVAISIALTPNSSQELATVVITYTPPLAVQKGDTLQMSASQFKVNPDASAEDLMRKVPGITIENGTVKAQGENVQKVTIDGRELFGDDASAALKNLPAEIIDKIQVFDRLSDQAQFTGFEDANTAKSINIVTKANMRNGQFGRVYAGYGTHDTYQAGGNATILKENRKISLVGNFNNVNIQNFSQQDLLGVTSSGGGRGGMRGGGGGRPGGGRGFGGGGGNFLVGTQGGINTTNAFGINYADIWGKKATVSGSYLFNNTINNTDQKSNLQYLTGKPGDISDVLDSTIADSKNYNHRVNMRIEYKIDSNNQLIISPNLSFQNNNSNSQINSTSYYFPETSGALSIDRNTNSSDRSGSNVGGNILYRHSFPKRGRTISINLNTSYNKNDGGSYVETFSRYMDGAGGVEDTSLNRFADQMSNGVSLNTNIAYTEPLWKDAQLQLNYSPSYSKSKSDQQTFAQDASSGKYDVFLQNYSSVFENTTTAQSGGVSLRYGNREKQLSIGVNYQHTNLNSERIFPVKATVDKGFDNILPNAMLRYNLSPRSNIRVFYRASVNQPSVNQLQDVLDPTNSPVYSIGNPNLNPQYSHMLSGRYTFTNPTKGILVVGNVFYQTADDYIANASYNSRDTVVNGVPIKGTYRLSKPINLDGYKSLRSFLTFAMPLKFIKSNFNLNGGISLSDQPGIINGRQNITKNTTYTLGSVLASNVSEYVDFTISYSANINKVNAAVENSSNSNYYQQEARLQLNLLSKTGWFFQNDVNNQYYSGLSQGFNQSYWLWNMAAGKKFLKGDKGELKLSVFDLLKQNQSISRDVTSEYIRDVQSQVLTQYFMLTFTYNLRNFGTAASRATNRQGNMNERGGANMRF